MAISVKITGLEELKQKLTDISADMSKTVSTDAAVAAGETLVKFAQANVKAYFNQHTMGLHDSLKVVITKAGSVRAGSYGIKYARIQEFGGIIKPNRSRLLSWLGADGIRYFARMVDIPPRPYLRPAYDEHKDDIIKSMDEVVNRYLNRA